MPAGAFTFNVVNVPADTTSPVISDVVVTPSVDVTGSGAAVTADFNVAEVGSGLDYIDFELVHVASGRDVSQIHEATPELITPSTEGAAGSGHYASTIELPVGSASGSWNVMVRARDRQSNLSEWDSTLSVVDHDPIVGLPELADASLLSEAAGRALTFTVHVVSPSEVSEVGIGVVGPSGQSMSEDAVKTSGSSQDGVWTLRMSLPDAAAAGTWSVNGMVFVDQLGRFTDVSADTLSAFPTLTWTVG